MPDLWRQNLRGRADAFVARTIESIQTEIHTLRQRVEDLARQASRSISIAAIKRALQVGGEAPLNVQGLLGRLAQPQTGGAPALDNFPSTVDPITQDGALFVLKGATNQLYRVKGDTEPETFELIGSSGSVTSVDLTAPSEFNVSGVPITTSGTITLTKAAQPANTVWAGPTSGGAAAPTFRALVEDDIPAGGGGIGGSTGSVDNAVLRADGTGGATLQASNLMIPDDAEATEVGYLNIPQNSQSGAYTLVLADRGKHIYHPTSDDNPRTWTIPANASVAFSIGTALTFVNDKNVITIAITSDTMVLAGDGSTGSRTLAENGVATAVKVTSTRWIINGTGLS